MDTDRNGAPMPIPTDGPSMHDLVCTDIQKRKSFGLSRYATLLQAFNGRDALQDLYEELMDALVYVRQVIEERRAQTEAGDGVVEHVARQVIDAKKRRLLLHLKQVHDLDNDSANAVYFHDGLIQVHLTDHRVNGLAHGYLPWGDE